MKGLLTGLGFLSLSAAVVMYLVGSNSSHLTELKDFFWVPLPLGVILLIAGFAKKKQA